MALSYYFTHSPILVKSCRPAMQMVTARARTMRRAKVFILKAELKTKEYSYNTDCCLIGRCPSLYIESSCENKKEPIKEIPMILKPRIKTVVRFCDLHPYTFS